MDVFFTTTTFHPIIISGIQDPTRSWAVLSYNISWSHLCGLRSYKHIWYKVHSLAICVTVRDPEIMICRHCQFSVYGILHLYLYIVYTPVFISIWLIDQVIHFTLLFVDLWYFHFVMCEFCTVCSIVVSHHWFEYCSVL